VRSDGARLAQLSRRLSALTAYHNAQLRRRIDELHRELPGAVIVLGDAERAFTGILAARAPDGGRFDYGFDLRSLRSTAVRDRRGVIPIQDHCYAGGYLGTRDPALVCAEEDDVFFWDNVHPTSFTHCWIAYFVARDLARAGLVPHAPELEATRSYCRARQTPAPAHERGPAADRAQVAAP
jgi:phospholipase/lecithinase/hemolysin